MTVEYDGWAGIYGYQNEWCKERCEYWEDCEECPGSCGLVGDYGYD